MKRFFCITISVCLLSALVPSAAIFARTALSVEDAELQSSSSALPAICAADHRVGKMQLTVTNTGTFGNAYVGGADCFTGQSLASCEYPAGSGVSYLYGGALWVGAVVPVFSGTDTIVSVGADGWQNAQELYPDEAPAGMMIHRSIHDPSTPDAISEDDIVSVYYDTLTVGVPLDPIENRPHFPLNIEVTETSMAWAYNDVDDFVLFDLKVRNHGFWMLNNVYLGVYVDADVGYSPDCFATECYADDICGFVESATFSDLACEFSSDINLAWVSDNDGDPHGGLFDATSAPGVTATSILRTPLSTPEISFNWWLSNGNPSLDFGPRERAFTGVWPEDFRDFSTGGIGTPEGDRNKYYIMRNQEFDYDQVYTASISPVDPLWMEPIASWAENFSDGFDARYLLSFGPFDIDPGEVLPITLAYVAGEAFHVDPDNYNQNLNTGLGNYDPAAYYDNLNFQELFKNARMAGWVYDNPGVDTDGNGYAGEMQICCDSGAGLCDTIFVTGDGVPDFQARLVPPPPAIWAERIDSTSIMLRFNGTMCETAVDPFIIGSIDFEGYDVYIDFYGARSWAHLYSYDLEDYLKYTWVASASQFVLQDYPFTPMELRCLYAADCNDLSFDPLSYTEGSPYTLAGFPDSVFYFEPMGNNFSELGVSTPIVKKYPAQPYPSTLDTALADPSELTSEGYFKYFEYEVAINNLIPGVYAVGVTASDFGVPQSGIGPQESHIGAADVILNTTTCCIDFRGNANDSPDDYLDISDITYLVDYIFGGGPAPACQDEADVAINDMIDITDLTFMVDYVFLGGVHPPPCW
ncbi:MAG: hypothetical protein P1R58_03170 [bacterium]|nr:hypothetical protein [bacterium]